MSSSLDMSNTRYSGGGLGIASRQLDVPFLLMISPEQLYYEYVKHNI
jgi:hypothetical protein